MTSATVALADSDRQSAQRIGRFGLGAALLISLAVALISFCWGRPWITSDTATGLLAWESWRGGGPWNCVLEPDPANIARDIASWVSWWSPGQYVWPGIFLATGLPLGAALIGSSLAAAWLRSVGLFLLLRRLGVSPRATALAVLIEAANWQLFSSFGMFIGGEVMQAAALPWLLLAFAALRSRLRWWPLALPALLFAAAFAKHTLFLSGLAGLAWLWWEDHAVRPASWLRLLGTGALLALCAFAARLAIARLIIGHGPTPGDSGGVPHGWMIALGFPAFAPLSAATGLGSIAGRLFAVQKVETEAGWQAMAPLLVALAPLLLASYGLLARHLASLPLRRLLIAVLAAHLVLFGALYFRGASISVDDRHFRGAGMLVIAALAAVAIDSATAGPWLRRACLALLIGGAIYGLAAEVARAANLRRLDRLAPSGITQPNLSRDAAAELLRRDALGGGRQVIFFTDPAPALEVKFSRRIATDSQSRPLEWFRDRRWRGRVPHLLLVLPAAWQTDPRGAALRECFPDYAATEWTSTMVGDCLFVSAGA
jgi:hypothetical protein